MHLHQLPPFHQRKKDTPGKRKKRRCGFVFLSACSSTTARAAARSRKRRAWREEKKGRSEIWVALESQSSPRQQRGVIPEKGEVLKKRRGEDRISFRPHSSPASSGCLHGEKKRGEEKRKKGEKADRSPRLIAGLPAARLSLGGKLARERKEKKREERISNRRLSSIVARKKKKTKRKRKIGGTGRNSLH